MIEPTIDDVLSRGNAGVISIGFLIALWSGSRALNVFVDTITIMYGMAGKRGLVRTRALSFVLYLVFLVAGIVLLPHPGRPQPGKSGASIRLRVHWQPVLARRVAGLGLHAGHALSPVGSDSYALEGRSAWRGHHCGDVGRRKRALAPRAEQIRREPDDLRPAGRPHRISDLALRDFHSRLDWCGLQLRPRRRFPRLSGIDHDAPGTDKPSADNTEETRYVVRSPAYVPADASNPNNWTPFPHTEKRFDSIKVTSGVLVRAYRSGNYPRLASAGATGALACSSDLGFDCAALRRPRPDRVDDVSATLPDPLARSLQPGNHRLSRQTGSCCFRERGHPHDHRDCCRDDQPGPHSHCATAAARPRRKKGEGQWALGYREPLNPNEQSKKDDNPLNVRARIENIYAKRGFASIDPGDLRGRFRWYGLYTQRRPGIDGGKTATLEPWELDDEYFMLRIRIDGGASPPNN